MLLPGLVAFAVAALLTPLLAAWARRGNLLDIPNERSSHHIATPRIGGAAFVLAFLTGVGAATLSGDGLATTALSVVGAACGLSLLGLADDVRPLPALLRLMIQIGISLWLVRAAGTLLPGGIPTPVAVALAALWMTAATNAFNFMDGIDGIAASQAIAAGTGWAIVGRLVGSPDLTLLGLLAAAAPGGFLLYNWSPARVFMGDGGSAFLGFLLAALPLAADRRRPDLWLCAALFMWPFLFDTAFTLLRRISRRENILLAHRSHIYQRLTSAGLTHATVAVLYFVLAIVGVAAGVALVSRRVP
jgi:Fuc2NAc and GlcNAc transferase